MILFGRKPKGGPRFGMTYQDGATFLTQEWDVRAWLLDKDGFRRFDSFGALQHIVSTNMRFTYDPLAVWIFAGIALPMPNKLHGRSILDELRWTSTMRMRGGVIGTGSAGSPVN